jgi:hypothetical protein
VTGQFLSVDSLIEETGQPYAYTAGDPILNVDPTGAASTSIRMDTGLAQYSSSADECQFVAASPYVTVSFEFPESKRPTKTPQAFASIAQEGNEVKWTASGRIWNDKNNPNGTMYITVLHDNVAQPLPQSEINVPLDGTGLNGILVWRTFSATRSSRQFERDHKTFLTWCSSENSGP